MTHTERDRDDASRRGSTPESARRHVVLHPRTASARRVDHLRPSSGRVRGYPAEADEVLAFMRAQRRNGLWIFGPASLAIAALFVASMLSDSFVSWRWGDVPMFWIVIGPVALFSLLAAAVFGERRTLRIERKWIDEHPR